MAELTIPRRTQRPAALDHEALFELGLQRIRELAERTWTDHNIHDPGITTLELLCYALTDLGYRASFPIADVLAVARGNEAAMREQFFTARELLPNRPLTLADYRKLLIDLPGVKNAWLEPAASVLYADTATGELRQERPEDMTGVVEVALRGLWNVMVEYMEDLTSEQQATALAAVRRTLHANRNLCEDFVRIETAGEQAFALCAELELERDAEVARVHADVLFDVQQYLSPPVRQYSLAEMQARRKADGSPYLAEDIFSGPPLRHGFIDDAELAQAELRSEIRLSDVISVIMDVPGVRAVRDIVLSPARSREPLADRWVLPVVAGARPVLDRAASRLVCYKRNLPFVAAPDAVARLYGERARAAVAAVETVRSEDFAIPLGRFRDAARYRSIQPHFPEAYGIGESGVRPGDERAQVLAQQLEGYLLLFDQVMANFAAQLANVSALFSTNPASTDTYFYQQVEGIRSPASIYGPADPMAVLRTSAQQRAVQVERRNRFLDHLIARYGEQFGEFTDVMRAVTGAPPESMIAYKCEFLRDYPAISAGRALAYDYTLADDASLWNSLNISGLERRLGRLLGIRNLRRRNLSEVSYDMYAEIDSTPADEFRFRIRRPDTGKIVLSSSTNYETQEDARTEMRRAIEAASSAAGYQRKQVADGRHYFNIVDATGEVIARRIEYFRTAEAMELAITELMAYLRESYSDEGMYVIEGLLLRPEAPEDPMLRFCPDPNCADCGDEDPYSYRLHIILPAYGSRFSDMTFRRWVEGVIREEVPAHIEPRICWIATDEMAELERRYRDWIYLKAGRGGGAQGETLSAFLETLGSVRNVYPQQRLRECGSGEGQGRFMLGSTSLGTMDDNG